MEIEKVGSFLLQVPEKDHAAHGGIGRMLLSPLVVFPKQRPSRLFPHHVPAPASENQIAKGTPKNQSSKYPV
jgi:hypothetical protein